MKKRMIKYNLIIAMLVVLFPTIYFLNSYFTANSQIEILDNEIVDDGPVQRPRPDGLPNTNNSTTTQPIQFRNGMEAVQYAVNILQTGISFENNIDIIINCEGIGSLRTFYEAYRYKNHEMQKIWCDCTLPLEIGNFYQLVYSNCQTTKERSIYDSSRYSLKDKSYSFTDNDKIEGDAISEYIENDNVKGWNNFFISVDSSLARVIYFDKSNPYYYTVKISFNQSRLNQLEYAKKMISKGALSVDMTKLDLTIKIDKMTGYMLSCTRDEAFKIVFGNLGSLSCKGKGIMTYKYVDTKDKIINIAKNELNVGY